MMRNRIKCFKKDANGCNRLVFECFSIDTKVDKRALELLKEFDKVEIHDYQGRPGYMVYQKGEDPIFWEYEPEDFDSYWKGD